jgi:predicted  nucleic acid-binding Zn-ribbon protein
MIEAQPIRQDLKAMTDELSNLREDLSKLRTGASGFSSAALARYEQRLGDFGERLSESEGRISAAVSDPDALIETAISATADELTGFVLDMRACRPTGDTSNSSG